MIKALDKLLFSLIRMKILRKYCGTKTGFHLKIIKTFLKLNVNGKLYILGHLLIFDLIIYQFIFLVTNCFFFFFFFFLFPGISGEWHVMFDGKGETCVHQKSLPFKRKKKKKVISRTTSAVDSNLCFISLCNMHSLKQTKAYILTEWPKAIYTESMFSVFCYVMKLSHCVNPLSIVFLAWLLLKQTNNLQSSIYITDWSVYFSLDILFKGDGHPKPKLSMLCVLSQNFQPIFEKQNDYLVANFLRNSKTALKF